METKEDVQGAPKKIKNIKLTTLVSAISLLAVLVFGGLALLTYQKPILGEENSGFTDIKFSFLPAVVIDKTNLISLGDVEKNLIAMRKFYETQDYSTVGLRVDFTTEDGEKRLLIKERELLNKLIEDRFVMVLAKKNGILITPEEVAASLDEKLDEYGNRESVGQDLEKHYGWTMEDFKEEIVLPGIYRDKLAQKIDAQSEAVNGAAKMKIEKAQKELKEGIDFAVVAERNSDGSTAKNGGELGWVSADQITPELAVVLFGEKDLEEGSIIESSLGYHIVDVEEKKKDQGVDVLKIRQIFVRKETFASWMDTQIKNKSVWIMLGDFVWNSENASVGFADQKMRDFENAMMKNAQGDASLLF